MNPEDSLTNDQLLEAVLTGDLSAQDPRVLERCAADPGFRAELEGLLELAGTLAADAEQTRTAHREAAESPAPVAAPAPPRAMGDGGEPDAPRGIGWWWLPGFVAAAALLVFLQLRDPDVPDFPGAGELLGGDGLTIELVESWDGTGLSYAVEGGPEEVSSLVEFLLDDGSTLAFPFDGTIWSPSPAEVETIPAGATWRLSVYDASGALIATYPAPAGP